MNIDYGQQLWYSMTLVSRESPYDTNLGGIVPDLRLEYPVDLFGDDLAAELVFLAASKMIVAKRMSGTNYDDHYVELDPVADIWVIPTYLPWSKLRVSPVERSASAHRRRLCARSLGYSLIA